MSAQQVIVAGWWTVDANKRDEVVEKLQALVMRARAAPGCLDLAITADTVDAKRINIFEFWQSEQDLDAWRTVSGSPKGIPRARLMDVQKRIIQRSGPPFAKRRGKRRSSTRR